MNELTIPVSVASPMRCKAFPLDSQYWSALLIEATVYKVRPYTTSDATLVLARQMVLLARWVGREQDFDVTVSIANNDVVVIGRG